MNILIEAAQIQRRITELAAQIEAEQWQAFEQMFHKAHEESLAWRFKPESEAEIAHVVKYFPELQFSTAKGVTARLDYEKVHVSDWEEPVRFASVTGCRRRRCAWRSPSRCCSATPTRPRSAWPS